MDSKFGSDVVGGGVDNVVGQFEAALGCFYRGRVIPIVAGWLGEVNKEFEELIQRLTRKAATGDDGMILSPLVKKMKSSTNNAAAIQTGDWGSNRPRKCEAQA